MITSVLDPHSSWAQMFNEAKRWLKEDIFCTSLKKGNRYWIIAVNGDYPNGTIKIQREFGKSTTMGFLMVKNFLLRLQENGTLTTNRDSHKIDVINVTTIVNLHQFLEFSDDRKYIVIRSTPKTSKFGEKLIDEKNPAQIRINAREVRQGGGKFRRDLLKAYNNCCCITETNVVNVLDAAHIIPYSVEINNACINGLLLRADIHNLFDDGLIKIDPKTLRIEVDTSLDKTEYSKLSNKFLIARVDGLRPDMNALLWHTLNT